MKLDGEEGSYGKQMVDEEEVGSEIEFIERREVISVLRVVGILPGNILPGNLATIGIRVSKPNQWVPLHLQEDFWTKAALQCFSESRTLID